MAKFLVIGNKKIYRMEKTDERTAWELAELELKSHKVTLRL